jgi:hypothetical protein
MPGTDGALLSMPDDSYLRGDGPGIEERVDLASMNAAEPIRGSVTLPGREEKVAPLSKAPS